MNAQMCMFKLLKALHSFQDLTEMASCFKLLHSKPWSKLTSYPVSKMFIQILFSSSGKLSLSELITGIHKKGSVKYKIVLKVLGSNKAMGIIIRVQNGQFTVKLFPPPMT